MTIFCRHCGGEGRKFESRYGGNDPDVFDTGECDACRGSGNQPCDNRRCKENAVAFNDDGEALCADCLIEWISDTYGAE
jgi:hypothetical protein